MVVVGVCTDGRIRLASQGSQATAARELCRYALCHALRALRQAAARSACTRTLLMVCFAWLLSLWSGRKILSSSAPSVMIRVRASCILLFSRPRSRPGGGASMPARQDLGAVEWFYGALLA